MRTLYLTALATAVILSACETDGGGEYGIASESDNDLTGTWSLESGSAEGKSTTIFDGDTISVDFISTIVDPTVYEITFGGDGTISSEGSVTSQLTYTGNGVQGSETMTLPNILHNGTFKLIGDELSLYADNQPPQTVQILRLDNEYLVIEAEVTQRQAAGGAENIMSQKATQTYERVD